MPNQLVRFMLLLVGLLGVQAFVGISRAETPPPGKLLVTVALWGDVPDGKSIDVTQKVVAMVKDGGLSVKADRATLGDAASGAQNKLKVGYTIDGVYKSKIVNDGEVLDISTRLVILKATYGDLSSDHKADVTDIVADAVRSNTLTLDAGNALFGDPAQDTPKRLKVDYIYDGVPGSITVAESQTLKLPAK